MMYSFPDLVLSGTFSDVYKQMPNVMALKDRMRFFQLRFMSLNNGQIEEWTLEVR